MVFFMGMPSLAWGEVNQKSEEILEFYSQPLVSLDGELGYFGISGPEPSLFESAHTISDSKHEVAGFRSSSYQENLSSILVASADLSKDPSSLRFINFSKIISVNLGFP